MRTKNFKNRRLFIIAMILFTLLIVNLIPGPTNGKEITNFDNGGGQPSVEIELSGGQGLHSDSTTYFSIPVHKGKQ